MKAPIFTFLLFFSLQAFPQRFLAPNEYHYSLNNRMGVLIVQDSIPDQAINLHLTFITGPFIETPGLSGLSYFYQKLFTESLEKNIRFSVPADYAAIKMSGKTSLENVTYQLSFPKAYLEQTLTALANTLLQPIYEKEAAAKAQQEITNEHANMLAEPEFTVHRKISGLLWDSYDLRRTFISMADSFPGLEKKLSFIHDNYYCPKNGFLVIRGDFIVKNTYDKIKTAFANLDRCDFDPFIRYPVPVPKVLQFNVQTIDQTEFSVVPFYQISFQGPTTSIDKRGLHSAMIFSKLLESPGMKLHHVFRDSSFIQDLKMHFEALKYSSQLYFILVPDSGKVAPAYDNFWSTMGEIIDSAYVSSDDMEKAKQVIIENFRLIKSESGKHVSLLSEYWAGSNLDDYSKFEDSIKSIQLEDIHHFIRKHMLENHFVSGLSINKNQRQAQNVDSSFTYTAHDVTLYQFYFMRNTAHFTNSLQDSILNSLIQFMKINPSVKIKINGVAESNEYLQVADAEIIRFISSLDYFEITPESLIPTKKIRLDVYRSMKIIKALIEAGIDQKRVVGTGQLEKTDKPLDSNLRAYCTLVK